eukprot:g37844.t1
MISQLRWDLYQRDGLHLNQNRTSILAMGRELERIALGFNSALEAGTATLGPCGGRCPGEVPEDQKTADVVPLFTNDNDAARPAGCFQQLCLPLGCRLPRQNEVLLLQFACGVIVALEEAQ